MSEPSAARCLNVVCAAPPTVRTPGDLTTIAGAADVIELRLDLLPISTVAEIAEWIAACPRDALATVRSISEGGQFEGTPADAATWLQAAAKAGALFVDVERAVWPLLLDLPAGTTRIASRHGAGPEEPEALSWAAEARWKKFAFPVRDRGGLFGLRRAARAASGFAVPFGPLAARRAALVRDRQTETLLFGAATFAAGTVAGQPPLHALLDELRAGEVGVDADGYGLIGRPPAWSPSPALHNAVFRSEDRAALYIPIPDLDPLAACSLGWSGFSVTTPYKRAAAQRADVLDAHAGRSGVANTLVRQADGAWLGLDTDALGIAEVLAGLAVQPGRGAGAFVYGSGGYAQCAALVLQAAGFTVRLGARDPAAGQALAETLRIPHAGVRFEREPSDRMLFNATPAGAAGEPLPQLLTTSLKGLAVLDATYRNASAPTSLVSRATSDGAAAVVDGRTLLLAQAVHQAVAFGASAAPSRLRQVMEVALEPPENLWLIGMRGAGKSRIGRALAKDLGRPFVDLDAACLRVTGMEAGRFIRSHGWAAFRTLEAELVLRVHARRGVVVATGGGVLEHVATRNLLTAAAHIVYLHVAPALAAQRVAADAQTDRPPLPGTGEAGVGSEAVATYEARDRQYRASATCVLDGDAAPEAVVRRAAQHWLGPARPAEQQATGHAAP